MWVTRTTALAFLGLWAVMQFFNGVASLGVSTAQTGGVAWFAHLGGFLFGLLIGFLLKGRAQEMGLERRA
jgi:membrane associated rhomboid family serine protease